MAFIRSTWRRYHDDCHADAYDLVIRPRNAWMPIHVRHNVGASKVLLHNPRSSSTHTSFK